MPLSIGFVMPPSKANFKPFRNQPLVLIYLMTILEDKFGDAIDLSLIDLRGVNDDSLMFHIPEKDVYLYSMTTPEVAEVTSIVADIKTIYPESKHIGGGAHVTLFPKESSEVFDSVVLGEGEQNVYRAINDYRKGALAKVYTQEVQINLDEYPIPNRKYLTRRAVVDTGLLDGEYGNLPSTTVLFSRGCPYNCFFCAGKRLMFGRVRFRSPSHIEQEIEYLKKDYGIQALALKDDNSIPVNVKQARPFLEAIGRTNVKWRGQSRANGIHPDMVKLAKDAGCMDIAIGIESASPESLMAINKHIDLDKAKEYIKLLKHVGIGVRLHFIMGLPNEPDDIVEKTLDFINETEPKSVLLSYLCPVPGSELFDNPDRFNIKITTYDWTKYEVRAGRFDANEKPTFVFEYKNGHGMTKDQIFDNYIELQDILRKRRLNF